MNHYRSTLRRRQLLKSGALAAFGVLGSAVAGHRLFQFPDSRHPADLAGPEPRPQAPPDREEDFPEDKEDADLSVVVMGPAPRPLNHEEEYAGFLTSLDLRHIAPYEVIDPHRGICNGVENELPPERLWDELAATLRVADEIRERLKVPLVKFSSAYRSPRYNREIPGAVHNSHHTRNLALDVVYYCPIRQAYDMAVKLRNERFFRGGIGLYPTFIHIDTRGYNANWRG